MSVLKTALDLGEFWASHLEIRAVQSIWPNRNAWQDVQRLSQKDDGPSCLPDVCLGDLFSNGFLLNGSLPPCSRGWASFAVKHSSNTGTSQAWIKDPQNGSRGSGQVCHVSANSSGMRACSLGLIAHAFLSLLSGQSHSFFSPNETEFRKPPNCFTQTSSYGLSLTQRGMVRFGWGSLCSMAGGLRQMHRSWPSKVPIN